MLVKYRKQEQAGGDGDSGGGAPDAAAIKAAVDAAVTGLKSKNAELLGKLTEVNGKLKAFDGIDLEEVRAIHEQFKNSQDLKDIREGKIDEVLTRRNQKFLEEAGKQAKAAQDALVAEQAKNGKFAQRVLDDSIRSAAINAGVHKHAIDDARGGSRVWSARRR